MIKCARWAQNYICEMGLLWETRDHFVDKCSIRHTWPMHKLATKLSKIKNQSQQEKSPAKPRRKTIQKGKSFHKNMYERVYDFPHPHLNLTMSSLGVKESLPPQKQTKTKKVKSHETHKIKRTHTKTLNLHTYAPANKLSQKHNFTQSRTRPNISTKLTTKNKSIPIQRYHQS